MQRQCIFFLTAQAVCWRSEIRLVYLRSAIYTKIEILYYIKYLKSYIAKRRFWIGESVAQLAGLNFKSLVRTAFLFLFSCVLCTSILYDLVYFYYTFCECILQSTELIFLLFHLYVLVARRPHQIFEGLLKHATTFSQNKYPSWAPPVEKLRRSRFDPDRSAWKRFSKDYHHRCALGIVHRCWYNKATTSVVFHQLSLLLPGRYVHGLKSNIRQFYTILRLAYMYVCICMMSTSHSIRFRIT